MNEEEAANEYRIFKEQLAEQQDVWERTTPLHLEYMQGSRTYGEVAVKSSLVLNGGALLAFPAYIAALGNPGDSLPVGLISTSATLFVVGIIAGAFTALLAYLNFQMHSVIVQVERDQEIEKIEADYDILTQHRLKKRREANRVWAEGISMRYNKYVDITFWTAVLLGCTAYVLFVAGAYFAGKAMVAITTGT